MEILHRGARKGRGRLAVLLSAALAAGSLGTAGLVLGATPTLTVTPGSTSITVGDTTNATATLSGADEPAAGTITIALFSDGACTTAVGTVTEDFGVTANGSFGPLATGHTTVAIGSLYWKATYTGDTGGGGTNDPASSLCVEVAVAAVAPTLSVTPDDTTITVGDTTNATATLSGAAEPAGGTITIALFSDSACATAVGTVTEDFGVTANGAYGPLTTAYTTTTAVGSLWWKATYTGDLGGGGFNASAESSCVEVDVAKATPDLTTTPDPVLVNPAPEDLADSATLAGGYSATGTITFSLFPPSDGTCAGTPVYTEDVTVSGDDTYDTTGTGTGSETANLAGVWNWTAVYSGDDNNDGDTSGCGDEEVEVYVDTFVVYAGQTYDADLVGTSLLSANLSTIDPACLTGDVTFTVTPFGGSPTDYVVSNTSPSTFASTTQALASGIYEVDVTFDPDNAYCDDSNTDMAVLTVVGPGASSTGGGWYKNNDFSPPRINFGYTVQKSYSKRTEVTTYRGQLLWMNTGTWRLKGSTFSQTPGDPAAYGTFTCPAGVGSTSPDSNFKCGSFTGAGVLQEWDSEANGGLGGWADYLSVTYTVTVYDGGTISVCKGKRLCTKVELADWFGIQIDPVPADVVPESAPIIIMKGSIKVS